MSIVFVFLVVFFFAAHRVFLFSPTFVETISSYAVYPFLQMQAKLVNPWRDWWQHRQTVQQLRGELQQLALERDELLADFIALKNASLHAEQIREVTDFKERYADYNTEVAHILLRHVASDGHYLLVDAGERKGVAVDAPVVYKNNLLGRVVEVWPQYSKVVLTTDPSCKVAAVCCDTNVHGIHQGVNSVQKTSLTHVSHLLQLKKDDLVISSGEGLVFPKGFALGTIEDFDLEGLHYRVTIRPLVSIHCIEHCGILKKI